MAITDRDVVDSVAYEDSILLLQLYDHLDFEGEFEKAWRFRTKNLPATGALPGPADNTQRISF